MLALQRCLEQLRQILTLNARIHFVVFAELLDRGRRLLDLLLVFFTQDVEIILVILNNLIGSMMNEQIVDNFVIVMEHLDDVLAELESFQIGSYGADVFQEMEIPRLKFLIFLSSENVIAILAVLLVIFRSFGPIVHGVDSYIYEDLPTIEPVSDRIKNVNTVWSWSSLNLTEVAFLQVIGLKGVWSRELVCVSHFLKIVVLVGKPDKLLEVGGHLLDYFDAV